MAAGKPAEEWLKQAEYDLNVARYLHNGGHYSYSIFMVHLAIEKGLKGLYTAKLAQEPPKTHNLIGLLRDMDTRPPEPIGQFLATLNTASITTRYPEDQAEIESNYTQDITVKLLNYAVEVMEWIKQQS